MSEDTLNKKFKSVIQTALERMETEGKSLASLRNRSSFDAQARLKDKNKIPEHLENYQHELKLA